MISYAPDQGSVGPHTDEYDVFLIQAAGTRRWSIETQLNTCPELIPDLDLAIMREFNGDESWEMQPGDMLYLPPHIPHHGVAVGDGCMTWSVGFRAPALADIADSFMLEADALGLTGARYRDVDLTTARDPAQITNADVQNFRQMLTSLLQQSDELWPVAVGKLLSDVSLDDNSFSQSISHYDELKGRLLERHVDSRIFYHQSDQQLTLFYNGQAARLANTEINQQLCRALCDWAPVEITPTAAFDQDAENLLLELVNSGVLLENTEDE